MKIIQPIKGILRLLLVASVMLVSACNKDEAQGRKSLEGVWSIMQVESIYANFHIEEGVVISIDNSQKIIEQGALGEFTFNNNQVSYNYTRNDSIYFGNGSYTLKLEKVNGGFLKVNKWTLSIADDWVFDVRFEDETKNSEKKANAIEMDNWPKTSGYGVAIIFKLEKQ